jgi:hypothetical protein
MNDASDNFPYQVGSDNINDPAVDGEEVEHDVNH